MSTKERVHCLVDTLSGSDLLIAERVLRGLTVIQEPGEGEAPASAEQRRARARAARGSMKGLLSSSDEVAARKREEIDVEDAAWQRMSANRSAAIGDIAL